jgi:hypothetical protein
MKQLHALAIVATALAGCQLATSLKAPGLGGGSAGASPSSDAEPVTQSAPSTEPGKVATVEVDSDLCTRNENDDADVQLRKQELGDRNTICTMITVDPAPGVAKIAPRAPGWCELMSKNELARARTIQATSAMEQLVAEKYWWSTTRSALGPLCVNPSDKAVQQQTAYLYQWWTNRTGLAPEQLDGLFRYFAMTPAGDGTLYGESMAEACKAFPAPKEEASERDRLLAMATRASLGCDDSDGAPYWVRGGSGEDITWHLDASEAPSSELARAYAVVQCLGEPDTIEDRNLGAYAACGMDARALDPKALDREIDGWHELAQAHARLTMAAARRAAARYDAVARAKAKEDPAWQALIYDAPAKGWKAWAAAYQASRSEIDAARAYELKYGGPSRKAAKGCWDDAWVSFRDHVGKARARTLDDAKRAMTDVAGTILLEQLTMCADAEGQELTTAIFGQLFDRARPTRGPRYAAYFAVLDALNELLADRDRFPLEPQSLAFHFRGRSPISRSGYGNLTELDLARDDGGGVVKKVKKEDGGVRVEFKTERWKEGVYNCKQNNRILQWRPDGTPVYDSDCTYAGKQWVERTHDPIWIPASMAEGIKPGTFVRSATSIDRHGDAWNSIPVEIWADKDRNALVAYLGVELGVK